MTQLCLILSSVLLVSEILATPIVDADSNIASARAARSPTFHKKHGHGGLGGLLFGGGGGNNYVTNINNFGPPEHGHAGSSATSSASAGGHGSSAQSQAGSVALGPFSAAFAQSQAQSGRGRSGGLFDYFDY